MTLPTKSLGAVTTDDIIDGVGKAKTAIQPGNVALTNARTPLSHKTSHSTGGSDPLTPANIGAATAAQGAKADTAIQPGNAALTNARTPTAHKASHATGGSDALTPADIGAAAAVETPHQLGTIGASVALPLADHRSIEGSVGSTPGVAVTLQDAPAGTRSTVLLTATADCAVQLPATLKWVSPFGRMWDGELREGESARIWFLRSALGWEALDGRLSAAAQPQLLWGDLSVNDYEIVSSQGGNIVMRPDGFTIIHRLLAASVVRRNVTAAYTIAETDNGAVIHANSAGAIPITWPADLPVDFYCTIVQPNTGLWTVTTQGDELVNGAASVESQGRFKAALIMKTAPLVIEAYQ